MFNVIKYFNFITKKTFYFNFLSPRKTKIVVFDGESFQGLKIFPLVGRFNYFSLKVFVSNTPLFSSLQICKKLKIMQ